MSRRDEYQKYIQSPAWKSLRLLAIKKAPYCALCSKTKKLHVHHRKYPKVFGEEPLEWLTVLCSDCHARFHKMPSRKKPKRNKKVKPSKQQKAAAYIAKTIRMSGPTKEYSEEEIDEYIRMRDREEREG